MGLVRDNIVRVVPCILQLVVLVVLLVLVMGKREIGEILLVHSMVRLVLLAVHIVVLLPGVMVVVALLVVVMGGVQDLQQ